MKQKTPLILITFICIVGILSTIRLVNNLGGLIDTTRFEKSEEKATNTKDNIKYDAESAPSFSNSLNEQINNETERESVTPTNSPNSTSLSEAMDLGVTMECRTSFVEGQQNIEGTLFIKNRDIKADFVVNNADGSTYDSKLLKIGNTAYIWTSTNTLGYKFIVENDEEIFSLNDLEFLSKDTGYTCNPAAINDDVFSLPTNINFQDFSQGFDEILQDKETLCGLCDNATNTEARELCRQQLDC